jgi:hypothetical protein
MMLVKTMHEGNDGLTEQQKQACDGNMEKQVRIASLETETNNAVKLDSESEGFNETLKSYGVQNEGHNSRRQGTTPTSVVVRSGMTSSDEDSEATAASGASSVQSTASVASHSAVLPRKGG